MPRPPRTCLTCGTLHHNPSRCDQCETQRETQRQRHRDKTHYDHTYRKAAKQVQRQQPSAGYVAKDTDQMTNGQQTM